MSNKFTKKEVLDIVKKASNGNVEVLDKAINLINEMFIEREKRAIVTLDGLVGDEYKKRIPYVTTEDMMEYFGSYEIGRLLTYGVDYNGDNDDFYYFLDNEIISLHSPRLDELSKMEIPEFEQIENESGYHRLLVLLSDDSVVELSILVDFSPSTDGDDAFTQIDKIYEYSSNVRDLLSRGEIKKLKKKGFHRFTENKS